MSSQDSPVPEELATAAAAEAERDDLDRAETVEKPTSAELTVHLDMEQLRSIDLSEGVDDAERREELQQVLDTLSKLPERLDFKPGVTIIVGNNGSGKSTVAQALYLAARANQEGSIYAPGGQFARDGENGTRIYSDEFGRVVPMEEKISRDGLAGLVSECMVNRTEVQSAQEPVMHDVAVLSAMSNNDEYRQPQDSQEHQAMITYGKSTRQGVDHHMRRMAKGRLLGKNRDATGGSLKFVDEPEYGISPHRHLKIESMITDLYGGEQTGDTVIVPTNSVVLYMDQAMPRIDLDHPERGVHLPTDYPDELQEAG